jgi:hypothetical protein
MVRLTLVLLNIDQESVSRLYKLDRAAKILFQPTFGAMGHQPPGVPQKRTIMIFMGVKQIVLGKRPTSCISPKIIMRLREKCVVLLLISCYSFFIFYSAILHILPLFMACSYHI